MFLEVYLYYTILQVTEDQLLSIFKIAIEFRIEL